MLTFVAADGAGVPARFSMDDFTISTPVPEPATYGLMLIGMAGLGFARASQRGWLQFNGASPPPSA